MLNYVFYLLSLSLFLLSDHHRLLLRRVYSITVFCFPCTSIASTSISTKSFGSPSLALWLAQTFRPMVQFFLDLLLFTLITKMCLLMTAVVILFVIFSAHYFTSYRAINFNVFSGIWMQVLSGLMIGNFLLFN